MSQLSSRALPCLAAEPVQGPRQENPGQIALPAIAWQGLGHRLKFECPSWL